MNMSEIKPRRAVADLTDDQAEAWELALERAQESRQDKVSGQGVLRELMSGFCRSQGVRFPAPRPRRVGVRSRHSHCGER
jgi:hypothetical protein